jgi:hypothetical protein
MDDGSREAANVAIMAQALHEMAASARSFEERGRPLHMFFNAHPMLKHHRLPMRYDSDQVHIFWLSDGSQGFILIVSDGGPHQEGWLAARADGDFEGITVHALERSGYIIEWDQAHWPGKLAVQLAEELVTRYGAQDYR